MHIKKLMHPNIMCEISGFADVQTAENLTEIAFAYGADITNTITWSEIFDGCRLFGFMF